MPERKSGVLVVAALVPALVLGLVLSLILLGGDDSDDLLARLAAARHHDRP